LFAGDEVAAGSWKLTDPSSDEKIVLFAGIVLVFSSVFAVLYFLSLSTILLVMGRVSSWWNSCFLVCSASLGGWLIYYSARLRIGGGIMFLWKNVLLMWLQIIMVLVAAIIRFAPPQRYVAISILAVSLGAFHLAVPNFLNVFWLLRQSKLGRAIEH
jgi:hypothetical protein